MKKLLQNQRKIQKSQFIFSIFILASILLFVIVVVFTPALMGQVSNSGWFVYPLFFALASALILFLALCSKDFGGASMLDEWRRLSGLHHWTELPTHRRIYVKGRMDIRENTVLCVEQRELPDLLWYVEFDVTLPSAVIGGEIILLPSFDELLFKDHQSDVHVLVISTLWPPKEVWSRSGERIAEAATGITGAV